MLFAYMRVLDPFVIVRHSPDGMGGGYWMGGARGEEKE